MLKWMALAIMCVSINSFADNSNYSRAIQALRDIRNSSQDIKKWAQEGKDRAVCLFESTLSNPIYKFGFEAQSWALDQGVKKLDVHASEQNLHAYENLLMAFCQADITRSALDDSIKTTGLKVPTSLAQVGELLDKVVAETNSIAWQMGATL